MVQTAFSHIVQQHLSRQNEDVVTDALAFVIESSDRARLGLIKLLRRIESDLPDLQFRTQQVDESARPDLWGMEGSRPRVLIENKFWAGLTAHQPVTYLQILAKVDDPTILMLVVPHARLEMVWRELARRVSQADITVVEKDPPSGVHHLVATSCGSKLAITSWDRLLSAIEVEVAEDPKWRGEIQQIRALCDAADVDAFQPIQAEDITDQRLPAMVLRLNTIVDRSVQLALTRGVISTDGLRPQSSWERSGRYIRFPCRLELFAWVGTEFKLWRAHGGTPIWLVFDLQSNEEGDKFSQCIIQWAESVQSPIAVSNGVVSVGLMVPSNSELDGVAHDVAAQLARLSEQLVACAG